MSSTRTIPKTPPDDPGLDAQRLFELGMDAVRRLARRVWTDHNAHDPGVTILELLCYALTDLSYRASLPIEDLLASGAPATFPDGDALLSMQPLTELDYRKLLLDLPGVSNAWVEAAPRTLYANLETLTLERERPAARVPSREVPVRGLYRVSIELRDDVTSPEEVRAAALRRLREHRNLCEDFIAPVHVVGAQPFIVCADVELTHDADVTETAAHLLAAIQSHLTPSVPRYTLDEMLARPRPDGSLRDVAEIYEGPSLAHGFIDDDELREAALRRRVYLSDVINVAMDVPGVLHVREMLLNALDDAGVALPLVDRWQVAVAEGRRAVLDVGRCRLVLYKRNLPFEADRERLRRRYTELRVERTRAVDIPRALLAPVGAPRDLGRYTSFQNHFPEVYGIGEQGLPGDATEARRNQALQLKGYLLLFDQVMANFCAQLARLNEFTQLPIGAASDEAPPPSYAWRPVDDLLEHERLYPAAGFQTAVVPDATDDDRQNRFLDHLIARYAERFREHESVLRTLAPLSTPTLALKRAFLRSFPEVSAARARGCDVERARWHTAPRSVDPATSSDASGLERRIAILLGIEDPRRRDLSAGEEEGLLLVESILLRDGDFEGPLLPACVGPEFEDGEDPYSYRVHVVLPAWAGRFASMDFRRYAEELLREEAPAHVLPRICWVSRDDMRRVERALRAWLEGRNDDAQAPRQQRLGELIDALGAARSVYAPSRLTACEPGQATAVHFVLGTHRLGSKQDG